MDKQKLINAAKEQMNSRFQEEEYKEIARIALAALEVEPVAWIGRSSLNVYFSKEMGGDNKYPVYAAPSAEPDEWDKNRYGYTKLFNAIADATHIQGDGISISVAAFENAMMNKELK